MFSKCLQKAARRDEEIGEWAAFLLGGVFSYDFTFNRNKIFLVIKFSVFHNQDWIFWGKSETRQQNRIRSQSALEFVGP